MAERGAVLITGASTGIGEASALRLAAEGFRVFAGVRREADGAALTARGRGELVPVLVDVTDPASIDAAAETVTAAVGDSGLAGLFCNAGISGGKPVEFYDLDEMRRMFETNVFGVVATIQAFLPLVRRGRGRVLVTGSIGGRAAAPFLSSYSATKASVAMICEALRVELRPWGIDVVLIEPGSIATPIWQKGLTEFDGARDRLPAAARELYGTLFDRARAVTESTAQRGIPADKVAEVVYRAMTARRPRTRYLVGNDARAQAAMRRLLPDRARDALVARYLGIARQS